MTDLKDLLATVAGQDGLSSPEVARAHLHNGRRALRRRRTTRAGAALGATLVGAVAVVWLPLPGSSGQPVAPAGPVDERAAARQALEMSSPAGRPKGTCHSTVIFGEVPGWARQNGYKGPAKAHHVFSPKRDLVAILTPGRPLEAGPWPNALGTTLFVIPRTPFGAGEEFKAVVRREGKGPTVGIWENFAHADPVGMMPVSESKPGCYRYTFTRGKQTSTIDLEWKAGFNPTYRPLPASVLDAVNAQVPDDEIAPHTAFEWVRTTRGAVGEELGRSGDGSGTGDPNAPIYLVQVPVNEVSRAVRVFRVVVPVDDDDTPAGTVQLTPDAERVDLSRLGDAAYTTYDNTDTF